MTTIDEAAKALGFNADEIGEVIVTIAKNAPPMMGTWEFVQAVNDKVNPENDRLRTLCIGFLLGYISVKMNQLVTDAIGSYLCSHRGQGKK